MTEVAFSILNKDDFQILPPDDVIVSDGVIIEYVINNEEDNQSNIEFIHFGRYKYARVKINNVC
jgi:hypothetical protein